MKVSPFLVCHIEGRNHPHFRSLYPSVPCTMPLMLTTRVGNCPSPGGWNAENSENWICWQNWLIKSAGGGVLFESQYHGWWKCLSIIKTALKNVWTLGSQNNLLTSVSKGSHPITVFVLISQLFIFLSLLLGLSKEMLNFNQQNKRWMTSTWGLTKSFWT